MFFLLAPLVLFNLNAQAAPPFQIDPAFTKDHASALSQAWDALTKLEIQPDPKSYYPKVFINNDLVEYMNERVHYLIAPDTKYSHLYGTHSSPTPAAAPAPRDMGDSGDAETFAENVGTSFWLAEVSSGTDQEMQLGNQIIPVTSSRVGVIRVEDVVFENPVPVILTTLIHEARHSDCTGGPELFPECGHFHSTCSQGDYAGLEACDAHPWGAYSVGAVFAKGFSENCTNCSGYDREAAKAAALDSLSRYADANSMLNGKFGDPDMSSSAK